MGEAPSFFRFFRDYFSKKDHHVITLGKLRTKSKIFKTQVWIGIFARQHLNNSTAT